MGSFLQRILPSRENTFYLITQPGEQDIEWYSMVLAVPRHKEAALEQAIGKQQVNASDYGRVVYYGAGLLDKAQALAVANLRGDAAA